MAGNHSAVNNPVKVHIDHVVKKFNGRNGEMVALNGVDLDIHENEFVCVVGPSGCGKSTLLNIIGGLTLDEPASDLAVLTAIASSYLDKPVPTKLAAVGEVGLSGELRSINHIEQRLAEVQRLGFTQCVVPSQQAHKLRAPGDLRLLPVKNIGQVLRLLAHDDL